MLPTGKRQLSVLDLSALQPNPSKLEPPRHRVVKGRVLVRKPDTIDGIVVHQTATPFGVSDAAIAAAGGDAVLAKHRRAIAVSAHMTAFDTGVAVLGHPLAWYVYHANALNARSLGIEIEGHFPILQGEQELFGGKLERAARDGLTYLVEHGRALGMPIQWIWAHRQSSMTRASDPGEEIWRKLVLEFAIPELGLKTQNSFVTGGRPIPAEWRSPVRLGRF